MIFLTYILTFKIQIKLQEANKVTKLSNDLTIKLNEAENKIADKIINKTKKEKVSEKVPRSKKTGVITNKRKKS